MSNAGKPGFQVLPSPPPVTAGLLKRFEGLASSNLADAMGRFNFMDPGIKPRSGVPLFGLAVTVQARPADHVMVHTALAVAQSGEIVVSTCGCTTSAVFGELMCHSAAGARLGDVGGGDGGGVAVVPRADAAQVLELVAKLLDQERIPVEEILAGKVFRADVDESLRAKGVIE